MLNDTLARVKNLIGIVPLVPPKILEGLYFWQTKLWEGFCVLLQAC
jgi:hypothetical protein